MKVIKVNDREQDFCLDKIIRAVTLANNSVSEEERMDDVAIKKVVATVQKKLEGFTVIKVDDIHDFVEQALVRHNKHAVAKSYILYRENKKKNKKFTPSEEKFISLLNGTSELRGDNANKHIDDNPAARDYAAGLMCKSIADKILPKEIIIAHRKGLLHYHDEDYSPVMKMHNCDLINASDMFTNTFQMGNTLIEPDEDTPFSTACNLLAQINLQVSGRQYGGQTVSWAHLLPFIGNSRRLIKEELCKHWYHRMIYKIPYFGSRTLKKEVEEKLRAEIYTGVKTYQYQVLCHSSSNGQTPFVSNNLCLREAETQQELDDFAILIEEIFKRRIKGVKDASGKYITPLFPKLLYWTCDGLNVNEGDPYYHLTELAALCEVARTQPDIVSEPQTRKVKKGQIIPSMGCRSLLGPIWEVHEYPATEKFYWIDAKKRQFEKCGKQYEVFDEETHYGTYPYGTFVEKRSFEEIPDGTFEDGYECGHYAINFRGNTGWLVAKAEGKVYIKQPIVYGRFNEGVVSINLPHVALEAAEYIKTHEDENIMDVFYSILNERLELCHKALLTRHESVSSIKSINSEILWRFGALARLGKDETVGDLMKKYPQRASISLGYVGLYETCRALIGESNTTDAGRKLSKEILIKMNEKCDEWKAIDHLNYSIYGTPEESLTYKFALANRRDFGVIEYITDKDYVVNSYHVDPRENIDAFTKIKIEGEYLALSSGGAVSYVETLDMSKNLDVIISLIQWMHNNIIYAEFNRKIGVCHKCGYEGDIDMIRTENGTFKFVCPNCGNDDDDYLDVTARLCGYLGKVNAGNTNFGRLFDIFSRVIHVDNFEENLIKLKQFIGIKK